MRRYDKLHERRDAGYVAVAVAGSLVVFCGILGLAADVGMLYFQKGHMQAAADSAALAGAREVLRANTASITSAATTEATSNGYTGGENSAGVTVKQPPTTGSYNADSNYGGGIDGRAKPADFLKVWGLIPATVK